MTTGARRRGRRTRSRPTPISRSWSSARACRGCSPAHRLRRAGVPFVIVEKDDDVGGTWYENTYPGCRVDNPNHNYSYSFAQRHDWPLHFSTQDVLLDYFRRCADEFELRPRHPLQHRGRRARPGTSATSHWTVVVRTADGREESLTANAVDQRGRPTQPARVPEHRGPRFVRRADVPFRALGSLRRPHRQARRGHRHWRERGAVHSRDRADRRGAARVPAHAAVAGPDTRLSRRGSARPSSGCTRTFLRTASSIGSGSSGAWATACSRASPSIPNGISRSALSA